MDGFRVAEASELTGIEQVTETDKLVFTATQNSITKLNIEVKHAQAGIALFVSVYDLQAGFCIPVNYNKTFPK
jgi:hypothetical protein